jgi:hypothetical protein
MEPLPTSAPLAAERPGASLGSWSMGGGYASSYGNRWARDETCAIEAAADITTTACAPRLGSSLRDSLTVLLVSNTLGNMPHREFPTEPTNVMGFGAIVVTHKI